jgi:ubiquinone/menaquinone biosynthesis C-methylase UbiE
MMQHNPRQNKERERVWNDPIRLIKGSMGPDMVQSYVMSCREVRDIVRSKVFLDIGGHAGEAASYAAIEARLAIVLNLLHSELTTRSDNELRLDNICLIQGDAQVLPLNTSSIDVILTAHTLEHIPNYRSTMSEIKRVLKEDGDLIIILPNSNVISGYNFFNFKEVIRVLRRKRRLKYENVKPYAKASGDGPTYHGWENAFDLPQFSQYLNEEGFVILNTKQSFFLVSGILREIYLLPNNLIRMARWIIGKFPASFMGVNFKTVRRVREEATIIGDVRNKRRNSLIRLLLVPKYVLARMHRIYLVFDSLERRLLPYKEGGMFLIHVKKARP